MPGHDPNGLVLLSRVRKEMRRLDILTDRERQVFSLLCRPYSIRAITDLLRVSPRTTESHISSIYRKLQVRSRIELMAIYMELEKQISNAAMDYALYEWDHPESQTVSHPGAALMPLGLIDDSDGYQLKPDPATATSLPDLEELMRKLWVWAGCPSSRRMAADSGGAFSHATISKLLNPNPGGPKLRLEYLRGFVHACGLRDEEEGRWVTAWRRISAGQEPGDSLCRAESQK